MIALLGFTSAVVYGASDFLAGLASRRVTSLLVSFVSAVVALIITAIATFATPSHWSWSAVILGAIAGLAGGIGTWAFYASLAIGPMSVVSPGVAMIYAVLPAIVGFALGERISVIGYIALAAVIVAAILLSRPAKRDGARLTPRAVLLGTVAGFGFAGYVIAIDRTPTDSGLVPLLIDLLVGTALYGTVLLVNGIRGGGARDGRAEWRGIRDRSAVVQAVLAGILLAAGTILLVTGLHLGDLTVMGVLNALYPLGTVILAFFVLKERLSVVQTVGIALALAASVVLGLT